MERRDFHAVYSNRFTGSIKQPIDRLAEVYVFLGEDELQALMSGALRVLRGQEQVAVYEQSSGAKSWESLIKLGREALGETRALAL